MCQKERFYGETCVVFSKNGVSKILVSDNVPEFHHKNSIPDNDSRCYIAPPYYPQSKWYSKNDDTHHKYWPKSMSAKRENINLSTEIASQ